MAARTLWVGTYPRDGIGTPAGRGEGIWRVALHEDGALGEPRLATVAPAPSFVAVHPGGSVLYAVDESAPGAVAAFAVRGEELEPLGVVASGGAYPCHLLVDGDALYVANYGDGVLGVVPLTPDGRFADGEPARALAHTGSGPDAERQEGPHAHFVAVAPGGHVLVVDLGTDEVRRYARTPDGLAPAGSAARLPAGTGPRHLAFSPDGRFGYVSGELSATVHVLAWDAATDTGTVVRTLPATAAGAGSHGPLDAVRDGDLRAVWAVDEAPSPSHVALDGDELVLGVRGVGVLSRFAVGADGLLTHRADQPLPTRCPRHLAVVGGLTVVAEQIPGAVTVLGPGGDVLASTPVPSAACVVPAVR